MELTRRRFDSLRKTKVLPKTVRSRLSKSLYSSSNLSTVGTGKAPENNASGDQQQKSASQQTVKTSSNSGSETNVTKKHKGKQRSKICTLL